MVTQCRVFSLFTDRPPCPVFSLTKDDCCYLAKQGFERDDTFLQQCFVSNSLFPEDSLSCSNVDSCKRICNIPADFESHGICEDLCTVSKLNYLIY